MPPCEPEIFRYSERRSPNSGPCLGDFPQMRASRRVKGRGRHVPTIMNDMTLHVEGSRWHGPDYAVRGAPVVGAPSHGYGYGVVAPTHAIARVPRI